MKLLWTFVLYERTDWSKLYNRKLSQLTISLLAM